jgi:hypothetical protein
MPLFRPTAPFVCRATLTANQTGIATATYTEVAFDSAPINEGGYFNTSNNRLTPPAGKLSLSLVLNVDGLKSYTSDAYLNCAFYKNASLFNAVVIYPANGQGIPSLSIWDVPNGTDYYEAYVYGASASTVTVTALYSNFMAAMYV